MSRWLHLLLPLCTRCLFSIAHSFPRSQIPLLDVVLAVVLAVVAGCRGEVRRCDVSVSKKNRFSSFAQIHEAPERTWAGGGKTAYLRILT